MFDFFFNLLIENPFKPNSTCLWRENGNWADLFHGILIYMRTLLFALSICKYENFGFYFFIHYLFQSEFGRNFFAIKEFTNVVYSNSKCNDYKFANVHLPCPQSSLQFMWKRKWNRINLLSTVHQLRFFTSTMFAVPITFPQHCVQ